MRAGSRPAHSYGERLILQDWLRWCITLKQGSVFSSVTYRIRECDGCIAFN